MTSKELEEYKDSYLKTHSAPEIKDLAINEIYINVPDTADRTPEGGISWINYWRAMSGVHDNELKCSHCGAGIKAELTDSDSPDQQAHGAHIKQFNSNVILRPQSEPVFKTYITPLCPGCNNPSVKELTLSQGSTIVEEIDPKINNQ